MSRTKRRTHGRNTKESNPDRDAVENASVDSFPASDAPAYTPTTALGPPTERAGELPADRIPEEIHEHPISDPSSRSQDP